MGERWTKNAAEKKDLTTEKSRRSEQKVAQTPAADTRAVHWETKKKKVFKKSCGLKRKWKKKHNHDKTNLSRLNSLRHF